MDGLAGSTRDGRSAEDDRVALDENRQAIPAYGAIVLSSPKRSGDQALRAALQPLLGKIDISAMREANLRAAGNDATSSPDAVARWLWDNLKYAILVIFILAAVLTPSGDPWNQTVFAAPMVVLYLLSIVLAWAVAPRKSPRSQ